MMASSFRVTRVFSFNLGTLPTQNVIPGQVGDIHDDYAHEIMTGSPRCDDTVYAFMLSTLRLFFERWLPSQKETERC